ncbi:MAG: hypothetical protein GWN02_32200 [Gemmatimonadetes bacterium]|nr:hypothetical protein [Gemmatimonadota bacterium]
MGSGSALAAAVLLGIVPPESDYRPPVRTRAGVALRGVASACIDTSDGLVAALDQLARLNDLAFRITAPLHRLLHPVARGMVRSGKVSPFSMLAGHHGEYELVFTVPEDRTPALSRAAADGRFTPVEIGRVEEGTGLWIGEVAVDGARIRNLLHECHGDIAAYAAGLAAEAPP